MIVIVGCDLRETGRLDRFRERNGLEIAGQIVGIEVLGARQRIACTVGIGEGLADEPIEAVVFVVGNTVERIGFREQIADLVVGECPDWRDLGAGTIGVGDFGEVCVSLSPTSY
jgi:hypothetical protein